MEVREETKTEPALLAEGLMAPDAVNRNGEQLGSRGTYIVEEQL
jgi:hypothetical protein